MGRHRSSPAPTPPASGSARSRAGRALPAGPAGSKRALAVPTPRAAPCSPEIRGCSPARRELGQPQTGPGPPEKPQGREETLSPAPRGSGPPPRAFVLRSPLMSLPGRRLPEPFRSSRPATSGPRIPGGDQPGVTPWRRGSPGAWGQTVVVAPGERLRSGPVRRHRHGSAVGCTEEAPVPLEEEKQPAAKGRAWEETLGSGRRAISTLIRADPGKELPQRQKRSSDSPGGALTTESYPEFSSNYWQDAPEHAEEHKSSCRGAAEGTEGTFPGGEVISSLASLRLAAGAGGVRQDTGAAQPSRPPPGSEFLRFRWAGREVNRQGFPRLAPAPYLLAGTPQAGQLGAPRPLPALRQKPREQREREAAAVSTTLPAPGLLGGATGRGEPQHHHLVPGHRGDSCPVLLGLGPASLSPPSSTRSG